VRRLRPTATAIAVAALVLAGCSDGADDATETAVANAAVEPTIEVVDADTATRLLAERDDLTIIDVRTPEEHAAGHVDGTELYDIQSPDFEARLADLDPEGAYLVYCRSGNRSAVAVATMADLGFVEVYDAGGYDDLAAAGAPTVS
jgi:phage shock protein E